uniref:Uncharacterized protein n=1 Tax=Oryza brachyantha TaxID=4533 RepID=J3L7F6_ORYBR
AEGEEDEASVRAVESDPSAGVHAAAGVAGAELTAQRVPRGPPQGRQPVEPRLGSGGEVAASAAVAAGARSGGERGAEAEVESRRRRRRREAGARRLGLSGFRRERRESGEARRRRE